MVIGILVLIIIMLSVRLFLNRRQLSSIKKQVEFIINNETNLEVSIVTPHRGFNSLAIVLNKLLKDTKKREYVTRKQEDSFKQSITSISHDLRTPLTSASGYIQMLSKGNVTEEKQKEYIQIIQSRIDSVNIMLNQLFEYTKLESGVYQLDYERIDLNAILCDTISMFYDELIQNKIEPNIRIEEKPLWIFGDASAWVRVIENIIGNAIKYGENSIEIELQQVKETACLSISNRTNAIEEKDVAYIFERFYTTDLSKMKKSTGLGLAIAKEFVVKMGGTIEAELNEGMFTIHIQMKTAI
ncbi:sensor histidine kinase [Anaerosporobacter sp.]|uniref:sensor histidine kinase n=1 Tax=Anaerosporobacter sp. TaxID=1872529 RepID=UPI00286F18F0|nr:HAMP domain-containing sensor histidine kinase [Anaerosporobacter sp.]